MTYFNVCSATFVYIVRCRDKVFVSGRISYSQYKDKNEVTQRSASIIAGWFSIISVCPIGYSYTPLLIGGSIKR